MRHTNLNSLETFQKNVTTSGTPVVLCPEMTASTIAFTAAGEITDSGNNFLVEGFRPGDIVTISGSTSNNKQVTIATVAAGTITVVEQGVLTAELAGASTKLELVHGRKVEDGVHVVIKAKATNAGTITLAESSARALNTNTNYDSYFSLTKSQAVAVQVKNLKEIWMDATSNGDGVEIGFES